MTVQGADDGALFAALASGGNRAEVALGSLYDRYSRRLLGLLKGRGFAIEEAEEIVQESFLKLYQGRAKLGEIEAPRAWLYRIVTNCSTDFLRRKQKAAAELAVEPAEIAAATDEAVTAGQGDYSGFMDCFESAYGQFEREWPERALVVRLAVIEGMSGQELADAIGRSYGAAREFLSQTRKKFQAVLETLCGDYLPQEVAL